MSGFESTDFETKLVTYSSFTGSTKGVAEAIAGTLTEMGEKVDTLNMKDVKDLSAYKSVIIGSAIQAGKWLPEAMEYIRQNKSELNSKPFAAFLVRMTLAMTKDLSMKKLCHPGFSR
jgi:menaquinone-dependent protoporphyrinogen oxidase